MIGTSNCTPKVRVLAVSPFESDHTILTHIFGHTAWELDSVHTLREALARMEESPSPVVLCEENLADGDWKDLLAISAQQTGPCCVIVMSENADERLWAEVLNIGAYDVLAKPLHSKEIFNSIGQAWRHSMNCRKSVERATPLPIGATAAVA
jgi:DNA-binding NtrC family response regulator